MLTHSVFHRFVEQISESRDETSFRAAIADAAKAFDLPLFAYAMFGKTTAAPLTLISTYPVQWTDRYLKSHYEGLDPVIGASHETVQPFEWGQDTGTFDLSKRQKEFFEEASGFGIRYGFTIPMRDGRGSIAAVTFASSERRASFIRTIRGNGCALRLMAASLHYHACRKLWQSHIVGGKKLSPREFECLVWAARGKSAWATAKILGISDATVRFHLAQVRAKLGVTTTRQAIALSDAQTLLT